MRQINKSEPQEFNDFLRKKKPASWNETSDIRPFLRDHILKNEQNHQCAYTELHLKSSESAHCHIDHFKTQSLFPTLFDDYFNLFVASKDEDFGAKHKDKVISSVSAYKLLLSPLNENLHSFFSYNLRTGEMIGLTEESKQTVSTFNLNHDSLMSMRLDIIRTVTSFKNQGMTCDESITHTRGFENLIRYIYTDK